MKMSDYPTIVRLISETQTQTGLRIKCALNTEYYPTKVPISDDQMEELDLLRACLKSDIFG